MLTKVCFVTHQGRFADEIPRTVCGVQVLGDDCPSEAMVQPPRVGDEVRGEVGLVGQPYRKGHKQEG